MPKKKPNYRTVHVKSSGGMSNIVGLDGKPMSRAYESASTSARLGGFGATDVSQKDIATNELELLQRRASFMERNTPWAARALNADTANEIGTGIKAIPKSPDEKFNDELKELHEDWYRFASADGILCAYGIQAQAARNRRESGEVFIRERRRRKSDGLPVSIQFQVIASRFCTPTLEMTRPNGNKVVSGIEFDKIGKRVAYWFYRQDPLDGGNLADMVRVPAEQIAHHFIPLWPGQIRGVPVGVQGFVKAYTYDEYDDAELVRKKDRSKFTGVIQYMSNEYNYIDGEEDDEETGPLPAFTVEPGSFPSLSRDEEMHLFDGDSGGSNDMDFARRQLMGIAASYGTLYEFMTGDYSKINDRIWRAMVNQYDRELQQIQNLYTIQQVCVFMHGKFVDACILDGLDAPAEYSEKPYRYKRAEYIPQARPFVHPLQDVQAMKMMKDEGFDSRENLVKGRNRDAESIDAQRAKEQSRENKLGLNKAKK